MVAIIRTVVSTAIRTKLLTVPAIVSACTDPKYDEGDFKYFLGIADGQASRPYIKVNHTYGGELDRTPRREFDQLWQIGAVADNQPDAEDLAGLIFETLIGSRLDYIDNWTADQNITFNGDYSQIDMIQGEQVWYVGGYFRIRGAKGVI